MPLQGHDLVVVPSNRTLVFEHSYTFWGNHRRLRVAAQPDVTLTWDHVPARCRRARVLLLGPLMPEDMHPASFVPSSRPWWERALGLLGPRQQVRHPVPFLGGECCAPNFFVFHTTLLPALLPWVLAATPKHMPAHLDASLPRTNLTPPPGSLPCRWA